MAELARDIELVSGRFQASIHPGEINAGNAARDAVAQFKAFDSCAKAVKSQIDLLRKMRTEKQRMLSGNPRT